jgi:hypothetical protein
MKCWKWILIGIFLLVVQVSAAVIPPQFGAGDCSAVGNPCGGGKGYSDIILSSNVSIVNFSENINQFIGALQVATSGNIIYINETANINLTGYYNISIPAGVTLASNRGSGGSAGGRIFRMYSGDSTTLKEYTLFANNNVRITGLRLEGNQREFVDYGTDKHLVGVHTQGTTGIVIDNNEMSGWSSAAIQFQSNGFGYDHYMNQPYNNVTNNTVKFNYLHHNQGAGYGYGVAADAGFTDVYGNVFDYIKHAVVSSGCENEKINISYNIYLGRTDATWSQVYNMHGSCNPPSTGALRQSGNTYYWHHNTNFDTISWAGGMTGTPLNGLYVYNNIFNETSFFLESYTVIDFASSISAWQNVTTYNNVVAWHVGAAKYKQVVYGNITRWST